MTDTDSLYISISAESILDLIPSDRMTHFREEAADRMVIEEDPSSPLSIGKFKVEATVCRVIK